MTGACIRGAVAICAVAVLLLGGAGISPAWAKAARPAPHQAAAAKPAHPSRRPVRVVATQHAGWGRLVVVLAGNPPPTITQIPLGVELRFAPGTSVQATASARLRQVSAIDARDVDGAPVTSIYLACDCAVTTESLNNLLRLDIRENPRHPGKGGPSTVEAAELDKLRGTLSAKLAILNGPPPGMAPAPGASAPADPAKTDRPAPPAQVCLAPVDMMGWRGSPGFVTQLTALRARIAGSRGGAQDMAALAEFYLANALGEEALAVASDALTGDATGDDRIRLTRDADIAHLLKGEQLDAASPLLVGPPGCERADEALWRALAAAAASDADGAVRAADGARVALRRVPEPLLQRLAFRIAGAVNDNPAALLAMAGALRNTTIDTPGDEAARFLLQAHIARANQDGADEAAFLGRAARYDLTVAGVTAKAELAALRVGQDGPDAERSEAVLADIARTYRYEALGQQAAEHYAEHRMEHGDYASALAVADESAGPDGPAGARTGASRGAALEARILRILLVNPASTNLPEPAERLALYWRYQGYTTPGDKGDDIRIGAARLMLAERMPDAALSVLRQVADSTAATPDARLLRAEAEARAGDPAAAVALLQSAPDGDAPRRVTADALERMGQFAEAAHWLDGVTALADQDRRAGLLFKASAWSEAATAYANLLQAPKLVGDARDQAAERYALALALSGAAPPSAGPKLPELPSRLLAALPDAGTPASPQAAGAMPALRSALERARHIERLLGPATANQGS